MEYWSTPDHWSTPDSGLLESCKYCSGASVLYFFERYGDVVVPETKYGAVPTWSILVLLFVFSFDRFRLKTGNEKLIRNFVKVNIFYTRFCWPREYYNRVVHPSVWYNSVPRLQLSLSGEHFLGVWEIKESKFRRAHHQLILGSILANSGGFDVVSGEHLKSDQSNQRIDVWVSIHAVAAWFESHAKGLCQS
jgi:hypothetical protein